MQQSGIRIEQTLKIMRSETRLLQTITSENLSIPHLSVVNRCAHGDHIDNLTTPLGILRRPCNADCPSICDSLQLVSRGAAIQFHSAHP